MQNNWKISNLEILVAREIPRSTRIAIYLSGSERQLGIFFWGLMIFLALFGWLHSPFSDYFYFAKGKTKWIEGEVTGTQENDYNKPGLKAYFRFPLRGEPSYAGTSVVENQMVNKHQKIRIEYNIDRPHISRIIGESRYVGSKGLFAIIWSIIFFVLGSVFILRRIKNVFYGIQLLKWGEISIAQIIYEKKNIGIEKRDVYLPHYVFYAKDGTDFNIRMSQKEIEEEKYNKVMPILYTELMEKCLLLQQIPGEVSFDYKWEIQGKTKAQMKKVLLVPITMFMLNMGMFVYLIFHTL